MLHQKPLHSEKVTVRSYRCQNVVEIIVLKKVSTANVWCYSNQRCMMTKGSKQLYPALCVLLCYLRSCRRGDKFKSSNYFCPTLYLIIPCNRVLEQLTGLQLVKKFPAFYGTRRFITAFTSVFHLSLSWGSPIKSIPHILFLEEPS
jgi:hypothetical protein